MRETDTHEYLDTICVANFDVAFNFDLGDEDRPWATGTIGSAYIRHWAIEPPEEFEQEAVPGINSAGATISFFRHEEIYQSDVEGSSSGERPKSRPPAHRFDASPAGYFSASCSPAELASASPAECHPEREEEE